MVKVFKDLDNFMVKGICSVEVMKQFMVKGFKYIVYQIKTTYRHFNQVS